MGKKAIGRLLGTGYRVRKGKILKKEAASQAEAEAPVAEEAVEQVVEEQVEEEVSEDPKPKAKRLYTRKKKSSKSSD